MCNALSFQMVWLFMSSSYATALFLCSWWPDRDHLACPCDANTNKHKTKLKNKIRKQQWKLIEKWSRRVHKCARTIVSKTLSIYIVFWTVSSPKGEEERGKTPTNNWRSRTHLMRLKWSIECVCVCTLLCVPACFFRYKFFV